jgi:hypothetical protein
MAKTVYENKAKTVEEEKEVAPTPSKVGVVENRCILKACGSTEVQRKEEGDIVTITCHKCGFQQRFQSGEVI